MAEIGTRAARGERLTPQLIGQVHEIARKMPLAPEPFLILGAVAQKEGQGERAERLYLEARDRDPRSLAARYFLADRYLRTGYVEPALSEMASLSRLMAGGGVFAPALAQYAHSPGAVEQLRRFFKQSPDFEAPVLENLSTDPNNLGLVLALWSGKRASSGPGGVPPGWQSRILAELVEKGEYAKAYLGWRTFSGVSQASGAIFNPDVPATQCARAIQLDLGLGRRADRTHVGWPPRCHLFRARRGSACPATVVAFPGAISLRDGRQRRFQRGGRNWLVAEMRDFQTATDAASPRARRGVAASGSEFHCPCRVCGATPRTRRVAWRVSKDHRVHDWRSGNQTSLGRMTFVRSAIVPAYILLCLILGGSAQGIWSNAALQLLAVAIIAWSLLVKVAGATQPCRQELVSACWPDRGSHPGPNHSASAGHLVGIPRPGVRGRGLRLARPAAALAPDLVDPLRNHGNRVDPAPADRSAYRNPFGRPGPVRGGWRPLFFWQL